MDIKADINWIKSELDKVKDPDLIEALKHLLFYRNKKVKASHKEWKKVLIERAIIAQEQFKSGNVHTPDQARINLRQHFNG